MKKIKIILSLASLALLAVGCVSQPLQIPDVSQKHYTVIGEGQGEATGLMLFGFIPINQNERFVRAYDAAVASKGGDALINPTIQENWFWAYVLDGYQTHVTGTVIKYQQ